MAAPGRATFLLPARLRLPGRGCGVHRDGAGRGDRTDGEGGERAQLLRHFELLPRGWPVAALTRAFDASDAMTGAWLRADPASCSPTSRARGCWRAAMRCNSMRRKRKRCSNRCAPVRRYRFRSMHRALRAGTCACRGRRSCHRWLRPMKRWARTCSITCPRARRASLACIAERGPVVLHQHPVNAQRVARGKPPVNRCGSGVVACCRPCHDVACVGRLG